MVRALHVITVSADGRELLLGATPDGRPTHSVVLDRRLARAVRGEDPDGASIEAALSPRDIQARLRAGATVEEVAAEAGVAVARVERFAGPVWSERERAVREALGASVRRARIGRSSMALGEAVDAHLAATGTARPETAEWTASRGTEGSWTVVLRVIVHGRQRVARWRYDGSLRELFSLDAYAAQIGFVDPSGPPPASPVVSAKRTAPAKRAAPVHKAAAKKAATKKPVAKKSVPAKKTAAKKAPANKVVAKKAAVPVKKAATKKAGTRAAPVKKAAAKTTPPRRSR